MGRKFGLRKERGKFRRRKRAARSRAGISGTQTQRPYRHSVARGLRVAGGGWWLRSDIIWAKRNCMPESVTDRPTRSHEFIFLLTKSANYFYDHEAIKEASTSDSIKRCSLAYSIGSGRRDGNGQTSQLGVSKDSK